jgi:hypothetical protein
VSQGTRCGRPSTTSTRRPWTSCLRLGVTGILSDLPARARPLLESIAELRFVTAGQRVDVAPGGARRSSTRGLPRQDKADKELAKHAKQVHQAAGQAGERGHRRPRERSRVPRASLHPRAVRRSHLRVTAAHDLSSRSPDPEHLACSLSEPVSPLSPRAGRGRRLSRRRRPARRWATASACSAVSASTITPDQRSCPRGEAAPGRAAEEPLLAGTASSTSASCAADRSARTLSQHLRQPVHHGGQVGQRAAGLGHPAEHRQAGQQAVPGRRVVSCTVWPLCSPPST